MLIPPPGHVYHLLYVYVKCCLALRKSFLYRIPFGCVKWVRVIDFLNLLNAI